MHAWPCLVWRAMRASSTYWRTHRATHSMLDARPDVSHLRFAARSTHAIAAVDSRVARTRCTWMPITSTTGRREEKSNSPTWCSYVGTTIARCMRAGSSCRSSMTAHSASSDPPESLSTASHPVTHARYPTGGNCHRTTGNKASTSTRTRPSHAGVARRWITALRSMSSCSTLSEENEFLRKRTDVRTQTSVRVA